MSDERNEAVRHLVGEVGRHLEWLRDAGVREVPAPVARPLEPSAAPAVVQPAEARSQGWRPLAAAPTPASPSAPPALAPAGPTGSPAAPRISPPPAPPGAGAAGAGPSPGCGSPELVAVRADLGDCHRCKLAAGRTHLVFGVGDPHAALMFVGEGPGADEDLQGEPFVGKAGQLLTRMIEAMGFRRDQVYIANVVKCRPPGNRNPEPDEIEACEPFLKRQLEAVRPTVIVALGKFAAHTLLRTSLPITRLRGQWAEYAGVKVMPTFHPAYLLRSPQEKSKAWEDLKLVMAALGRPPPVK